MNSIKIGIILLVIIGGLFISFLFVCNSYSSNVENTISNTFNSGDIPTSYLNYDSACNLPSTLAIMLPKVDSTFQVSGIDISYSMTALGNGRKVQQKSQVFCYNTNKLEPEVYSGIDPTTGKMEYLRKNVEIANGSYPGGTILKFRMNAWRTFEGIPGCNSSINRVDATSWKITVHYTTSAKKYFYNKNVTSFSDKSDSIKGMVPSQLTFTERNLIQNANPGTIIWCRDCGSNGELQMWNGKSWKVLVTSTANDTVALSKKERNEKKNRNKKNQNDIAVKDFSADTLN